MKSKMHKTLKILYPDEFKPIVKKKRQGFIARNWKSFTLFLSELGKMKLVVGTMSIAGLAVSVYSVYAYNYITTYENYTLSAAAGVKSESQRRNDLINNLVPPTLNYSIYEKDLFSHVVEIRKELTNMNTILQNDGDNSALAGTIKSQLPALLGIFENYPDLKASQPFADLMKELIETENRLAAARLLLNEQIRVYNTYITKVPVVWISTVLGYEVKPWFEAAESALVVPDMKILDSVNASPAGQQSAVAGQQQAVAGQQQAVGSQ